MQPYAQPGYPPPPPPPQKSNLGLILGIIGGVVVLVGLGVVVLGILAVSGTRKYVNNAKQAEAKNSLGQIGRDAAAAYESVDPLDPHANSPRRMCPSASQPVPADKAKVRGLKYMSSRTDWSADEAKNAGFSCLKFELISPQYYQYDYKATSDSFSGFGRGDLDGNGKYSEFELRGQVQGGHVILAPSILERDPDE